MAITHFRFDPNIDDLGVNSMPAAAASKRGIFVAVKSGDNKVSTPDDVFVEVLARRQGVDKSCPSY
jgi:hypothetical protein